MIELAPDIVAVWFCDLNVSAQALEQFSSILTSEERNRAARYKFANGQRRFTAGRAFLRQVLGAYLGLAANQVRLAYEPKGKPVLSDCPDLHFNLAHSEDIAALAVARGRRVGIDIEVLRYTIDTIGIARRFFTPAEAAWIEAADACGRAERFLACWTCKEAYLKALGDGLLAPLDSFEAIVGADGWSVHLNIQDPAESGRWSIERINAGPGTAAAVVAERSCWTTRTAWWKLNV
jgi:4'-phosphopantetheinyl transferase